MPSADTASRVARIRRRERQPAAATETAARRRVLVASAKAIRVDQFKWDKIKAGGLDWQREAWAHYDTCPELHAGAQIMANASAQVQLIAVEVDANGRPGTEATDDPEASGAMADLFGGPTGQSQAQAAIAIHLTVAGECWIVCFTEDDGTETWEVAGVNEVVNKGGAVVIEREDGAERPIVTDRDLLFRVWRPHPQHRHQADSPVRALLPVLRELASFSAGVSAAIKSRLAGAGILWLAEEIEPPKTQDEDAEDESPGDAAGWSEFLADAMTAPISDPDSAAAVVPIVAQVPGEHIQNGIRHDKFGYDLDSAIQPMREAAIRRIATGLDLPAEMLLGLGGTNHWSAWQISEAFAKTAIGGGIFELVCAAITTFYLRPALDGRGDGFAVAADLTALLPAQTDKENAAELYGAGLLSDEAYMAALGFNPDTDRPKGEARTERLALQIILANPTGELVRSLGKLFFPADVLPEEPVPFGARPAAPAAEPDDSGGDEPSTEPSLPERDTAPEGDAP